MRHDLPRHFQGLEYHQFLFLLKRKATVKIKAIMCVKDALKYGFVLTGSDAVFLAFTRAILAA